jgi:HEAT repeat protein
MKLRHSITWVALFTSCVAGCANRAKHSIDLYESGDYAASARAADEGLSEHPDDDSLWGMRVRAALALGDGDAVAKAYASYTKQRGDDDKPLLRDLAVATIAQALGSPSVRLKIAAIDAVAELELMSLADDVAKKLEDQDDRVVASAAIAVLRGYAQAPEAAAMMLKSEKPEARRIAVDGIGRKIGKLALADLEHAADDQDARVRATALRWLGQLKDADAVAVCTKRLGDRDENVRAAAGLALARIGLGNLPELGKKALGDRALAVRLAGIELYAAGHRDDLLAPLADDKDPLVALAAALAMKPARTDLAGKAVERAVAAEEPTTRAGAANYLIAALGKPGALPVAQKLAADPDVSVRLSAARVLARAGDKDGATAVFVAALATDHAVQAAADLAALGDARGLDELAKLVHDPARTPEARADAAAAHRTAHHVTAGLVAALADPSGAVRVEAAATLAALAK